MGHFIITLEDNNTATVQSGTVRQELSLKGLFTKGRPDQFTGYSIVLNANTTASRQYHIYKSKEGQWYEDADRQVILQDAFLLAVKRAIIQKELELNGC